MSLAGRQPLDQPHMHRAVLFRRVGCSLKRFQGATQVVSGSSDFQREYQKLLAETSYTSKFKLSTTAADEFESNLVKGCKVVS